MKNILTHRVNNGTRIINLLSSGSSVEFDVQMLDNCKTIITMHDECKTSILNNFNKFDYNVDYFIWDVIFILNRNKNVYLNIDIKYYHKTTNCKLDKSLCKKIAYYASLCKNDNLFITSYYSNILKIFKHNYNYLTFGPIMDNTNQFNAGMINDCCSIVSLYYKMTDDDIKDIIEQFDDLTHIILYTYKSVNDVVSNIFDGKITFYCTDDVIYTTQL